MKMMQCTMVSGVLALAAVGAGCAGDSEVSGRRNGATAAGGSGDGATGGIGGSGGIFDNVGASGGSDDGAPGDGAPRPSLCPRGEAYASRVKAEIALVVDGSRSMIDFDFRQSGSPRWDALQGALTDADEGIVARFADAADFGVRIYQSAADSGGLNPAACPYPDGSVVAPAPDQMQAISVALEGNRPSRSVGTTPTAQGLMQAYDAFEVPGPDSRVGPQVVVLATDGEPNGCVNEFQVEVSFLEQCPQVEQIRSCTAEGTCVCFVPSFLETLQAVQYGRNRGVWTYVLSLAEAQGGFATHLQELANAGVGLDAGESPGAAVYVPGDPAQLRAQLAELLGRAVSCDVTLNGVVDGDRAAEGIVTLDGEAIAHGDPDGWVLLDESTIRARGAACERFRTSPSSKLEATFPCEVFTVF